MGICFYIKILYVESVSFPIDLPSHGNFFTHIYNSWANKQKYYAAVCPLGAMINMSAFAWINKYLFEIQLKIHESHFFQMCWDRFCLFF